MLQEGAESKTGAFEWLVLSVIVANTAVLIWGFCTADYDWLIEHLHNVITVFFVFEMVWRLRQANWNLKAHFRQKWNIFDAAIIFLSLVPIIPGAGIARIARLGRVARMIHAVRHVQHLRWVRVVWQR